MRIPIRTSNLARWARRFGALAVPLLVLAVVLRLLDIIDVDSFEVSLAVASVVGGLAVIFAVLAYVRMWHTGDLGWKRATIGLLGGLVALAPLGYATAFMLLYPTTADISTAPADDLPALALQPEDVTAQSLASGELARRFPEIVARNYALAPDQVFALVEALAGVHGWTTVRRLGPTTRDGEGTLNVLEETLFGWQNEIVFRVRPTARGSRLDLRAAPVREGWHDLGHNGQTVSDFLDVLDDVVSVFERNIELVTDSADPAAAND